MVRQVDIPKPLVDRMADELGQQLPVLGDPEIADSGDPHAPDTTRMIVIVAGDCCGFEHWRPGTREKLAELMDGYLRSFTGTSSQG
jgi:hypothetical protein